VKAMRKAEILEAAILCAQAVGYQWITLEQVAAHCHVSKGTVVHHYGTMIALKRAVLAEAVARNLPDLVAQGLADRNPIALEAPEDVRQAALASLGQ